MPGTNIFRFWPSKLLHQCLGRISPYSMYFMMTMHPQRPACAILPSSAQSPPSKSAGTTEWSNMRLSLPAVACEGELLANKHPPMTITSLPRPRHCTCLKRAERRVVHDSGAIMSAVPTRIRARTTRKQLQKRTAGSANAPALVIFIANTQLISPPK